MEASFDAADGRRNFACAVVGPAVAPVPGFAERRLQIHQLRGAMECVSGNDEVTRIDKPREMGAL
jgi:hypothetical protein